jgi:prevent-host-death family protein
MKTINASKARKYFAEVLASVVKSDEPLIIVRYNEPIAALIPMSRLDSAGRPVEQTVGKGRPRTGNGRLDPDRR